MEFGGYKIMVKLPFKMNFIFDFSNEIDFDTNIFAELISELQEIEPFPNVKIYIDNSSLLDSIYDSVFNQIPFDLNIIFLDDLKINSLNNKKCNFVCNLDNIDKALKFLEKNSFLKFQRIVINHGECCLDEISLNTKLDILNKINMPNVYLEPYLTEKEIKNYYSNREQNRGFLSCAACWLSPIIKANGDIYCCKYNKIGNIKEKSFWSVWNCDYANIIRSKIINQKQLNACNNCNMFYKDSFLVVENSTLEYKDIVYQFASELNYVNSSPQVIITKNAEVNKQHYLVDLYPIFSDKEMVNNYEDVLLVLK